MLKSYSVLFFNFYIDGQRWVGTYNSNEEMEGRGNIKGTCDVMYSWKAVGWKQDIKNFLKYNKMEILDEVTWKLWETKVHFDWSHTKRWEVGNLQ